MDAKHIEIERALVDYLLKGSINSLEYIIDAKHGLYNLILKLFNRNGIYRDRFSQEEFPSLLFIILKTHRISLIAELDKDNVFNLISKISNLMLRTLNQQLYKEERDERKEVYAEHILDNTSSKNTTPEEIPYRRVLEAMAKYTTKEKLVLGMYFGIKRSYSLSVDQICSIVRLNRSYAFAKIKQFKEEIKMYDLLEVNMDNFNSGKIQKI